MTIIEFPPIEEADEHGLLAVGGDLEVDSLLLAYRSGIFPWPLNARNLAWFSPPERTVLIFDEFHRSRSLKRTLRRAPYECRVDHDFRSTIEQCAKSRNRKGQRGTWITAAMIEAYCRLHHHGIAHSFECYSGGELVGGLYGVSIAGMFAAESMFYTAPDASKVALSFAVDYLRGRGAHWLDAQVMNPFLAQLGFREIPRGEFVAMLQEALLKPSLFD